MYHFKDAKPLDTVKKIKNILTDIGIEVEHYEIYSGIGDLHSYRVEIKGTKGVYGTNGKGINKEYALASAYAEFLERVQNNLLFSAIRDDSYTEYGFYYSIDEREFDIKDLAELEEKFLSNIIAELNESSSVLEHLKSWSFLYPNKGRIITFPFKEYSSGVVHYIPIHIVKIYMGSNGMCSGNSKAEALVQGISELFERYAMKRILSERLTMPKIPESEYSSFAEFYDLVKDFRCKSGFELNFYDASLGEGLPVVAAIGIDKKQKKYHVHFGAHPVFEIALERSVTEMMQGQRLSEPNNFMDFDIENGLNASSMSNRVQMYINGIAYAPLEFFKAVPSYAYKKFESINSMSNEHILDFLLNKVKGYGWGILYRDTSFSGFNSYHVHVDCMSIHKYDDATIKLPELFGLHNKLFVPIRRIADADGRQLRLILNLLKKFEKYNIRKRYRPLTNSFLELNNTYGVADISVFIVFILLKLGRFRQVQSYLNKLNAPKNTAMAVLKEYLLGLDSGYSHKDLVEVLGLFYENDIIDLLERVNSGEALSLLPNINCFECDNCLCRESCVYKLTKICRDKYFLYLLNKSEV